MRHPPGRGPHRDAPRDRARTPAPPSRRYQPELVVPPAGYTVSGPTWLEYELGAPVRKPRPRRQRPGRGPKPSPWAERAPLGSFACVRVKRGFRAAVQETAPDQYIVSVFPAEPVMSGEIEVGFIPIAAILSAIRFAVPQVKAAVDGAKAKRMQPVDDDDQDVQVSGPLGRRMTWLEAEVGRRTRPRRPVAPGSRPWAQRAPLGEHAALGVRAGYRALVHESAPDQYIVSVYPEDVVRSGEVEVGMLPIAAVLSMVREVLPQAAAARRGARAKGLPEDPELDDEVSQVAGYGCSGGRCMCGR